MMKKLSKIALLAAASAFMLAVFPACGDDDEEDDPPKATLALVGDPVVLETGVAKTVTATVTLENDTFSAKAKAIPADGEIPTGYFELEASAGVEVSAATLKEWTSDTVAKISFTAKAAEGAEAGTISAKIKEGTLTSNVSLTAEGKIAYTVESAGDNGGDGSAGAGGNGGDGNQNQDQGGNGNQNQGGNGDQNQDQGENGDQNQDGDGEYTGEPTTDTWDFTTYSDAIWVSPDANGTLVVKDSSKTDGTYTLSSDASVKGADGVLTLTVAKTGTGKGVSKNGVNYSYTDGTTDGLRIKNDALKIANVKGKVALKIEWSCISGKNAGERNLEVTLGDDGTTNSVRIAATTGGTGNVAMPPYEQEFDAMSGTNIYIGASNNLFIKKITITKRADSFAVSTDESTANDLATLGLVGKEVASSNPAVATAKIAGGKIKVASVGAGSATLTVTDANGKTATVSVTVKSSGEIAIGAIVKFARSAPTLAEKTPANSKNETKGSAKASWDGLTELEYSPDGEQFVSATTAGIAATVEGTTVSVTGLDAGTYYVRGAASDAYEASAALKITISDDGAEKTAYTLVASDIAGFSSTNKAGEYSAPFKDIFLLVQSGVSYDESKGIKINGLLQATKNHIKFTTTGTTTVTMTFMQASNTTARYAQYATIEGSTLGSPVTGKEGAVKGEGAVTTTFEGLPAGTYAVGGDNGIYVTELKVEVVAN